MTRKDEPRRPSRPRFIIVAPAKAGAYGCWREWTQAAMDSRRSLSSDRLKA